MGKGLTVSRNLQRKQVPHLRRITLQTSLKIITNSDFADAEVRLIEEPGASCYRTPGSVRGRRGNSPTYLNGDRPCKSAHPCTSFSGKAFEVLFAGRAL